MTQAGTIEQRVEQEKVNDVSVDFIGSA